MNARLLDARHGHRVIPLEKLPVLIGRGPDAEVQVPDRFASRHHCEISERDGTLFVRDLGSSNGCLVNGQLRKRVFLKARRHFKRRSDNIRGALTRRRKKTRMPSELWTSEQSPLEALA